ncbi:hypothetical protein DsansV1_C03g0033381 [Dioscorea sansibarensis]
MSIPLGPRVAWARGAHVIGHVDMDCFSIQGCVTMWFNRVPKRVFVKER